MTWLSVSFGILVACAASGTARAATLVPPPQHWVVESGGNMRAQPPDSSLLKLGATFTLEAWVFPEVACDSAVVLGRNSQAGYGGDYTLVFQGDRIVFAEGPGQNTSEVSIGGISLPRNSWSHVAGALDSGGQLHLYVNGHEIASAAAVGPPNPAPTLPFQVASVLGTGAFALREARVWNRALSSDEITAFAATRLTGDEHGLIADWPLDDGAGQTARDIGPNHLDLQLGATPQPDTNDPRWARTRILDNGPFFVLQTEHANDLSIDCGGDACSLVGAPIPIDFNHDGAIDLLATTWRAGSLPSPLVALQNDGSGHFTNVSSSVFTGGTPLLYGVSDDNKIVADFNGDGLPDVYLGDGGVDAPPWSGAQSRLLFTTSEGHFVDATTNLPQVKSWTEAASAADFRRLGRLDILTDMSPDPSTGMMFDMNDGTGHFSAVYGVVPNVSNNLSNHVVDVNNDSAPDIVFGRDAGGGQPAPPDTLYLNDGSGHFHAAPDSALPPRLFDPTSAFTDMILSADFDGDGWQDLVEIQGQFADANHNGSGNNVSRVVVLLNNRDGTFRYAPAPIPSDPTGVPLMFAIPVDLNGDGKVDLVVVRPWAWPQILINIGNATFVDASEIFPLGAGVPRLVADIDGDGLPDLVILMPYGYEIAHNVKNFDPALIGPVRTPHRLLRRAASP